MPMHPTRKREGRGRGPTERASFALGSDRLDRFATRCERSQVSMTAAMAGILDALLEGKLVLINGYGELVHLHPDGGTTEPFAVLVGSPTDYKPIPKVQLPQRKKPDGH